MIELRVAVTTNDYERLVKFYCDDGIEPAAIWDNGQGQALILNMGSATLEIFDETQAQTIDQDREQANNRPNSVRTSSARPKGSHGTSARTWSDAGSPAHCHPMGRYERLASRP